MSSIEFDKVRLFNELQRWSLEDLQTLCFYLELGQPSLALSYDKLAGQTSSEKARSLIRHLQKYEGFQSWAHLRHTVEEHFTFMDATFLPELTQTPPPQLASKPDRPERVPDPKPAIQATLRQIPVWGWIGGGGVLAVIALLLMWPWGDTPPTPTPTVAATQLVVAEVDEPTPMPTLDPNVPNVPPPNAQLGDEWVRPKDGMVMVFVPAGTFMMGSTKQEIDDAFALCVQIHGSSNCSRSFYEDEVLREVALEGFWMDKYEVTNVQYQLCVDDGVCPASSLAADATYNGVNYPVVGVSWHNAVAYAEWVGAELPTEEQWEYAARGEDRLIYPWGDEFDGTWLNCDFSTSCPNDGYQYTAPVKSYVERASWVGALNMVGNVWEWTSSPYSSSTFVLRGGSWGSSQNDVRASYRISHYPDFRHNDFGFRLVSPIFLDSDQPAVVEVDEPTLNPTQELTSIFTPSPPPQPTATWTPTITPTARPTITPSPPPPHGNIRPKCAAAQRPIGG